MDAPKVGTRAIQSAVRGREEAVLDALGINWRDGKPHIQCPFPDHDDGSPSWRFVQSKARAYCSCIEGSASVFDIVMKMRGCDFEAAKLFVAETIGRQDLIKEQRPKEQRFVSSDAASLLNPPDDLRDDSLIGEYMAFRLGIDKNEAPMPDTPIAGWSALPYFDPPSSGRRNAKPLHVGDFPCAVFGQIDVDGLRHAHRIYLAKNGAGKAELGNTASGYPRNPKKSAKVLGNDTMIGRCALWGDPTRAPRIIVAEGIETAFAIADAFSKDTRAGNVVVAAAVSATGIEAFQPWPATKRITVAADRDEGEKENGKPGSRRGEHAARKLGLRLHERLKVDIALPGMSGETVDYLDVYRHGGTDAVRLSIESARLFVPTRAELDEREEARGRTAEIAEVAKAFPLPELDTLQLLYQHTDGGQVKVHKLVSERNPATGRREQTAVPIATPLGVTVRLRQADQDDAYGLRIAVKDMNGHPRTVDIDRAQLARRGAPDVTTALYSAGLRTEADGEAIVIQALKGADPKDETVILHRPGWQDVSGLPDPIFLTPSGDVIGAFDGQSLELAMTSRMDPDISAAGGFEEWKTAISAALAAPNCEHWTICIVAAFAASIASLAGLDTCGINLSGMSSGGKSTGQRLTASAWSTPDIRKPGLCQSARTTTNAIEINAVRSTGTVFVLDELAHVNGKEVARMIYMIAGGVGKARMNSDATIRKCFTWSTFAVFSGENSLAEKITQDGGEWSAGMAVRIVDVDTTNVNRTVDAATLERINAIDRHYGHAGPTFVRKLVEAGIHRQPTQLRDRILRAARQLAGETVDSAVIRAAMPFAILFVAGELAKTFDVLPTSTDVNHAVSWAWENFKQSSDSVALTPVEQAIGNIREYTLRRWGVTIKPLAFEGSTNTREADGWFDDDVIYLTPQAIREATGHVVKERQIGVLLESRDMLAKRDGDHYTIRHIPKLGKVRAYALKRSEFGRTDTLRPASSWFND